MTYVDRQRAEALAAEESHSRARRALDAEAMRESTKRLAQAEADRAHDRRRAIEIRQAIAAQKAQDARIHAALGVRNRDEVLVELLDRVAALEAKAAA